MDDNSADGMAKEGLDKGAVAKGVVAAEPSAKALQTARWDGVQFRELRVDRIHGLAPALAKEAGDLPPFGLARPGLKLDRDDLDLLLLLEPIWVRHRRNRYEVVGNQFSWHMIELSLEPEDIVPALLIPPRVRWDADAGLIERLLIFLIRRPSLAGRNQLREFLLKPEVGERLAGKQLTSSQVARLLGQKNPRMSRK